MPKPTALISTTLVLSFGALLMAAAPTPTPSTTPATLLHKPGGDGFVTPASYPVIPGPGGVPRIHLWPKTPSVIDGPETDANPTEPTLDIYLPANDKAPAGGFSAVLILPGGGYTGLATDHEGQQEANFFKDNNVAGFVLRYRHAPRYRYPIPLIDSQRAMRLVRSNAQIFHLNPDKIGIMGFSAGGHLAAMTATMFDNAPKLDAPYTSDAVDVASPKPNFAILMYPVIDLTDSKLTHAGSRSSLTQNNKDLYEPLSPQLHVTKDTPPAFLVHGTNDRAVPVMNSILYYEACLKAGVPAEMHILENGPHGFGMGRGSSANPASAASFDDEIRSWPDQLLRWMTRHTLR
jgi:acetyl esterase/lipase